MPSARAKGRFHRTEWTCRPRAARNREETERNPEETINLSALLAAAENAAFLAGHLL
jgi:hypothetical protein